MKPLVDVAELNIILAIADRLKEAGLYAAASNVTRLVIEDLRPLSNVDLPKWGSDLNNQQLIESTIYCSFEGCEESYPLVCVSREGLPSKWLCLGHLPDSVTGPGFPHPKFRDSRIKEAWENFFKKQQS